MNRGHPPSPALEHLVCDLLARGASLRWAAEHLGIPPSTMRDWVQGRLANPRYQRFAESVAAARQEHLAGLEQLLEDRGRLNGH